MRSWRTFHFLSSEWWKHVKTTRLTNEERAACVQKSRGMLICAGALQWSAWGEELVTSAHKESHLLNSAISASVHFPVVSVVDLLNHQMATKIAGFDHRMFQKKYSHQFIGNLPRDFHGHGGTPIAGCFVMENHGRSHETGWFGDSWMVFWRKSH